ncbi:MAG: dual specificity protein phosphatase family protein [Candidatus Competibacteraceae bacterium]|jgi:atypical dual specificity phosphatase|nr:dual specificity protein phosphatase family protein [Candidatus Competibacteraceae bacterium]
MWSWRLSWNQIRPDIIIGSCPMKPGHLKSIQAKSGATALLSIQHQECLDRLGIDYPRHVKQGERLGLVMARCPMRDFDPADQRLRLPGAVQNLHALLCNGHRVYVHCTAGINRSSLVVLAYFIFVETQSEDLAFATIQLRRPEVAPYWDALHACQQDLLEQHQDAIRERARHFERQSLYPDANSAKRKAEQEIIREALTTKPLAQAL